MIVTSGNALRRVVSLQPADNAVSSKAGSPYASRPGVSSLIDRHYLTIETRQGLLHQPLSAKDKVAFGFQPCVVLSHCFPGAVIETKWPTP